MRANIIVSFTSLLFLCLTTAATQAYEVAGEDKQFFSAPLKGVNAVAIEVNGVDSNQARYGLSADKLRSSLQQRLEAAGLQVVEPGAFADTPGAALLKLDVRLHENSYYYSLGLKLSLQRKVALEGSGFTTIRTWSEGKVGALTSSEFSKIGLYTTELADSFIKAYQAQNAG